MANTLPANALEWQWDCTWTHGQSLLGPIQNIWHPHWSTFPEQLCFPFSGGVPGSCSKNHHTLWQPQCTWPYILHSVQFNNLPRWYYKKMVMFIMKCNTWLHSCSPLSYSLSMSRAIKTLKETMALILAGQTEYWVWSASFHLPLYCMHSQASAQPDSPTWIPAPLDPQCHQHMPQQLQIIVIICARNTTGWFRIAVTSTALWSNMPYKSLQKIDWKSKNSYMIGYHIRVANPLHHQIVIVIMPTWTGNFLALSRVSTPPPNTFVPSAPAWLSSLHSTAQIDSHMFQLLWQGLVSSIWQQ